MEASLLCIKEPSFCVQISVCAGEHEGAAARLIWDRMPRNTLRCKVCGEQREDFCAGMRHKSNGILKTVKRVHRTFLTV